MFEKGTYETDNAVMNVKTLRNRKFPVISRDGTDLGFLIFNGKSNSVTLYANETHEKKLSEHNYKDLIEMASLFIARNLERHISINSSFQSNNNKNLKAYFQKHYNFVKIKDNILIPLSHGKRANFIENKIDFSGISSVFSDIGYSSNKNIHDVVTNGFYHKDDAAESGVNTIVLDVFHTDDFENTILLLNTPHQFSYSPIEATDFTIVVQNHDSDAKSIIMPEIKINHGQSILQNICFKCKNDNGVKVPNIELDLSSTDLHQDSKKLKIYSRDNNIIFEKKEPEHEISMDVF